MAPGATPNWIFPVIPSANNSVYNAFNFIYQGWRPLYWTVNGVVPEVEQNMSLANVPTYSNGNKTVTITMKSNYKWSNGKPLTADDLLFTIDTIKAAIKVSPANWAGYTPKFFPDTLVSTSEPDSTTLVLNLKSAVNNSGGTGYSSNTTQNSNVTATTKTATTLLFQATVAGTGGNFISAASSVGSFATSLLTGGTDVGAAPAARIPLLVAPALIPLPVLVPAMVVMNIAPLTFPMTRVVLAALIVRRHPIRIRIGRVRPVAVVPTILTVLRVPVPLDPHIVGTGLWRNAIRARGRRRGAHVNVE